MQNTLAISELLELMLKKPGMVVLRNPQGTTELKGDDLVLKNHGDWMTIYHGTCESSETRSHLHMRKQSYAYAVIREEEGYTPHMTFWVTKNDFCDNKPPFAVYFPSFYDWSGEKTAISENHEYYREWVSEHGREFDLIAEEKNEEEHGHS